MATGAIGGSQLDVGGLARQLVAAERAPLDTKITRDTTKVTTQISAMGALMGSMAQFRATLNALKTETVFNARTALAGDDTIFTATADADAVPGNYDIEVVQLARAQQLASGAFAGGSSQVVGTGTLTLSLGGQSFSVTVGSDNSTLAGIRDAINGATDNPGVRATLITGTGGSRLVLTSAVTGATSNIEIAQAGGDGGLAQLAYSASATTNYTQLAPAQDAIIRVATFETVSSTNVVENAIDGVTLTLLAGSAGSTVGLAVNHDTGEVEKRINDFVNAYNALKAQISKLGSFDAVNQAAGPLLGDSLLTSIDTQLRRTLSTPVPGADSAYQTLASIGITTQANGLLGVDSTKVRNALTRNFDAVGKLFGSEEGIAAKLFTQVDDRLAAGGAVEARNKKLADQRKAIEVRKVAIETRMENTLQRYIKQFTALDTLLSSLQTTSSYLSQQLDQAAALSKSTVS